MSEFFARFYDGRQARSRDARLFFDAEARTVTLLVEGLEARVVEWKNLRIEPPLGRTARRVWLDGDSHAEVEDTDEFRRAAAAVPEGWMRLVSAAETHKAAIFASVGVIIFAGFLFVRVALPGMAHSLAFKLPQETLDYVSDRSLETLDRTALRPSELSEERRRGIVRRFERLAARVPDMPPHRIEFRRFAGGPNAFALPSGTIIMTDEMVAFAESDEEIFAVLGHELGHVKHRHGMRLVLQQTGVLLAVSFFLGDISGSLSSFGALPIALLENGYSRGFEQEADDYGAEFCVHGGIGTGPMAALFERLAKEFPDGLPVWFSSHPDLAGRAERARVRGEKPRGEP